MPVAGAFSGCVAPQLQHTKVFRMYTSNIQFCRFVRSLLRLVFHVHVFLQTNAGPIYTHDCWDFLAENMIFSIQILEWIVHGQSLSTF